MKLLNLTLAAALLFSSSSVTYAGADDLKVPENFHSRFVQYSTVDRADSNKIRFLYVNPEAIADAKTGEPAPYGTTIVMEDRKAKLDNGGKPVLDSHGRFIPTDEVIAVIMQQKEKGLGQDQADEDVRNPDWAYAIFSPDHKLRQGINYQSCHACHNRVAPQDYNFSFASFLERIKGN
jgi:hypothetical protein